jgi:PST family polysaccharide transporter
VALWAQLASLMELVTGVALAGVATGVSVYVARTSSPQRQHDLLVEALKLGLLVTLPVAAAVGLAGWLQADALSGGKVGPALFVLAGIAGWIAVAAGVVNNYWLGQQRRDRMLALAAGSAAVTLAAAVAAPPTLVLELIVLAHALPAVVVWIAYQPGPQRPRFRSVSHPLRRYILPGFAIGILGPGSLLFARSAVGDALSWHDAGVLQALWRLSDWVCAFAGGILSVHYLPRFAAARGDLGGELRAATRAVLPGSALVLALIGLAHAPLLTAFYEEGFVASNTAVALLFAGALARIAAWIPLFALFARRRTYALVFGELLSLPLFAALVWLARERLSLEVIGVLWLAAYLAYAGFNFWALKKTQ